MQEKEKSVKPGEKRSSGGRQTDVVVEGRYTTVWIVRILTIEQGICVLFVNECEFISDDLKN